MNNRELAQYVTDQLSELDGIRSRAMMGGYIFYCRERIFGGMHCDLRISRCAGSEEHDAGIIL